jgi:hypothetical protein
VVTSERQITVDLSKQDSKLEELRIVFNKLQDNQVITGSQFRIEIIGPHVPEALCDRLYSIFASQDGQMTFNDLLAVYFVFTYKEDSEMSQLCFELIKLQ